MATKYCLVILCLLTWKTSSSTSSLKTQNINRLPCYKDCSFGCSEYLVACILGQKICPEKKLENRFFSENCRSNSRMDLFNNYWHSYISRKNSLFFENLERGPTVSFHFRVGLLSSLLPKNHSKWLKFEFLIHLLTKICHFEPFWVVFG